MRHTSGTPTISISTALRTVYPNSNPLTKLLPYIPLSTRSVLIKQCQAQYNIPIIEPSPFPTIIALLDSCPDIIYPFENGYRWLPARKIMRFCEINVEDPLVSAVTLDVIRAAPVSQEDQDEFRTKGWATEFKLCLDRKDSDCNFHSFFHYRDIPIHPDLPYNPISAQRIRHRFHLFKAQLRTKPPVLYARASHKNMSRSTRRDFEEHFGDEALLKVPIFGQDDWQRVKHEHGIELGGELEFRQKWYPSGAKPRTYGTNGGTSYKYSRYLQTFFTSLTDIFPETNHKTRLDPSRLVIPNPERGDSALIYDLSSFTSNAAFQKKFCSDLAEFFDGVMITVVDEELGPIPRDLGEMLREYNTYCVNEPLISLERMPAHIRGDLKVEKHGVASLLGIFGNLMTCTLGHYLIMSSCANYTTEINVAGDDGIIVQTAMNRLYVPIAISLVGSWALEKVFDSLEEGAIALKRPIEQIMHLLFVKENIIPPTLVTALSYLRGENVDPRYQFMNLSDIETIDRVSLVGVDLFRFLRSAYKMKYTNIGLLATIWRGYAVLIKNITGRMVSSWMREGAFFPVKPDMYEFLDIDPYQSWIINYGSHGVFKVRERIQEDVWSLRYCGDEIMANSSPRLVLLERLGYLERKSMTVYVEDPDEAASALFVIMTKRNLPPPVYSYTAIKDVPEAFLYDL